MTHYEQRLERDLAAIRKEVAQVGRWLDEAVTNATRSLLERDRALAARTILGDYRINRATRAIDHLCHTFVARHLPSAGSLRYISAVLRSSIALERIGDYEVAIAREAVQLARDAPPIVSRDIEMMSEQARSMLVQALKAFDEGSAELARGTMTMEAQANVVYRKVYRDLLAEGERSALPVGDLFALLISFSRLERISDQAKNICEETVFAVTGEVKQPKVFRILFLDERNAGPSLMAERIARKAFPESGRYESAGWNPNPTLDPGLVEFMARHGHDVANVVPRRLDRRYESLCDHHILVALEPGGAEQIPEIPFETVFLDWSESLSPVGSKGEMDDARRESLFKILVSKITDLMEALRGDHAG